MKAKERMGLRELAQHTYQGLKQRGLEVTLSGGACVSIYTRNAYQSGDLDFVRRMNVRFESVSAAMEELGFERRGRHFVHPDSDFYVEFPPPPLTVGEEPPREAREYVLESALGRMAVRMLSPTDCVKDRLCGYFYWKDRQSLDQAVLVASSKKVDLAEIERWAGKEGMKDRYADFLGALGRWRAARRR
jgi:hypothetical protein